jgi:hypothetical protein
MVYVVQSYGALFWTLSIVFYAEVRRPQRFGDWIGHRPQVDGAGETYSVGPVTKTLFQSLDKSRS